MVERGFGRVLNITSISVKQPIQRLLLSNTFRAGVTGMAKTLSDEVSRFGVTVNNIAPGYIRTGRQTQLFTDRAQKAGVSVEDIRDQVTDGPYRQSGGSGESRGVPRKSTRFVHHRQHHHRGRWTASRFTLIRLLTPGRIASRRFTQ
jgi:NAD(P)-dependent dehydrogenase (short-subunit alcohol dehydrogenase family)